LRVVRVAVIDSGVNPRHPHISGIAGGVSIGLNEPPLDLLGHGTAVMAAIQEKAGSAEYFAVRVFHHSLRTSTSCLLRAIEWTIEQRMDVVNLSLGTRNASHAESFAPLVDRAVKAGIALVAAAEADGEPHYPGCMDGVFAVNLDPTCPRDEYRVLDGTFLASGYPRPAPGIPEERNLQGISFAVANMTGFVVRARQGIADSGLDALRSALYDLRY
jgi:hypothetical protein